MIERRETEMDRRKEAKLLAAMAQNLGCQYNQNPNTHKYKIDGWFYQPSQHDPDKGKIVGWAECKWYNKKAHFYINPPKYAELIQLCQITKLSGYFIFRESGRWGYMILHDGINPVARFQTVLAGGTPPNRAPNDDDIEPLLKLNEQEAIWV